ITPYTSVEVFFINFFTGFRSCSSWAWRCRATAVTGSTGVSSPPSHAFCIKPFHPLRTVRIDTSFSMRTWNDETILIFGDCQKAVHFLSLMGCHADPFQAAFIEFLASCLGTHIRAHHCHALQRFLDRKNVVEGHMSEL